MPKKKLVTGTPDPAPKPSSMPAVNADPTPNATPSTAAGDAEEPVGPDGQKKYLNWNPDAPGCEGCFANALHFFGAFGGHLADVTRTLNAHIDGVHAGFLAENKDAPRDQAGRENEFWHVKVAQNALKAHYGDGKITFKKLACTEELDTTAVYKSGKNYVLDGILAPRFHDPIDNQWVDFGDYRTFDEKDLSWRHCVGLMSTGRDEPTHYVLGKGLPGDYDTIGVLHLDTPRAKTPRENIKFFWRITQAFEIDFPNILKNPREAPPPVEPQAGKKRKKATTQKRKKATTQKKKNKK